MDELLEQFLIECRELTAQAARDLAALARDRSDAAAIDSLFRAIHTLKGSFGIFALAPAERLLHAAEDVLDAARGGRSALDGGAVDALLACLDQVDRWADAMEHTGALESDAAEAAGRIIARLGLGPAPEEPRPEPVQVTGWLDELIARERAVLAEADQTLTAFRYTPDAECFFRGDDPLAIAAAVPDLLTLAVLPAQGAWPGAAALEPFACVSVLEGLSGAGPEQVRAAFRLVPDQVELAEVQPAASASRIEADSALRGAQSLRIDAGRIDALGESLAELLVAVRALAPLTVRAGALNAALASDMRAAQGQLERLTRDLHGAVAQVRAVPLEPSLRRLPRMAREIAESLGKEVDFAVNGQAIEVDRQIADGLYEPLLHLLRNAIDHGIEAPRRRADAGKPARGQVTLGFRREGDMIEAALQDDGSGIDPAAIRGVAVSRGVLPAEAAEALDDAAALRLIFAPGFSTAAQVTGISGRGVGMNAVQAAVEALRGTIAVESKPGEGTTFRMRVPASGLTTALLVIQAGGERYGVALDQVAETVRVERERLMPVGRGQACVLRGHTVPVLNLAALLGNEASASPADAAKLLVTHAGGERVALEVDGFGERIDALVRPPAGLLGGLPGVAGSTLMSDGGVLLVLDLPELAA